MTDKDNNPVHGQTIALAGLYQAARLVQQTAHGQVREPSATQASIGSLFVTSPGSAEDVYYGLTGLATGLQVLCQQLSNDKSVRDLELTAYVITLLHLERKLFRQSTLLDKISHGIDALMDTGGRAPDITADVITALAAVYTGTISTLAPRIMVKGEPGILSGADSQSMIRALLLAGMRAAVLWQQCGGSRIKLVFRRKSMLEHARILMREASSTH